MARGTTTQNLFLQIGGSASGVQQAAKIAKVSMAEIGTASANLQTVVAENFRKLGGGDVVQSARQLEASYRKTFANIRAAAEDTLSKPMSAGSIVSGNVAAAEQQLMSARATAQAYRDLADAQTRLVTSNASATAGEREMAVVLETQALAAKESVIGAEQQIIALKRLQGALGVTADAEAEVAEAHGRMGASGMIAEHVIRAFSDSIAAGQSPIRAATMQIGRVTEALTLYAATTSTTTGAVGKFAAFMGGPWGIAVSVAAAALPTLIEHLSDAGDESTKLKDKTLTLVEALSAEKFGTEAATKALQDYNREKERARDNDSNEAQRALTQARADIANGAKLRDQYQRQAAQILSGPMPSDSAGQQARIAQAQRLQGLADNQTRAMDQAQAVIRNSQIDMAQEAARAAADPIEAIRQKYKHLSDAAIEAAGKSDKLAAALSGVLTGYSIKEAAEIKAAEAKRAADRAAANDNRQAGRSVTIAQAEDIVQGIGGRVTSSYRSTAKQEELYAKYKAGLGPLAAKPGTSMHETGQALDIAKSAGMTLAKIVEAFAAQGVHLTERLDEGDHYHVAWGKKGPSADTMQRRQEAATRKDANEDRAFQGQLREANASYLDAMLGLSTTTEQRYQISIARLRSDLDGKDKALDDQVKAGSLSEQEALQLKVMYGMTEALQEQRAKRDEMTDLLDQQLAASRTQIRSDLDLIQARQQGAIGRRAQYGLAQQALSKQQEDRRADIAQRINNAARDPIGAENAVRESQNLPELEGQENKNLAKQYQSPLDQYRDQLKSNVGDMKDSLQGVAVDGLRGIEDGLTGLLSGTESVKKAFKSMATSIISDLVRIGIEKAVLGAITGGSFFGLKLAGGGKVDGFAMGGIPGYAGGVTPSRGGNRIRGAGTGKSDSILARLTNGKFIRVANGEGIMTERAVNDYWPMLDAMNKGTFKGFADGGLPVPRALPDLSSAEIGRLGGNRQRIDIAVRGEEGPFFRPVIHSISGQHASIAQENGAEDGANRAQERQMWQRGRKLGGSR